LWRINFRREQKSGQGAVFTEWDLVAAARTAAIGTRDGKLFSALLTGGKNVAGMVTLGSGSGKMSHLWVILKL
jgi:hypothetical protein